MRYVEAELKRTKHHHPRDFRVVTFGTHDELAPSDEEDEGVERNVMN